MHRDAAIHRFVAWLSLVGYCVVALGLPLPLAAVAPGGVSPAAEKRLAAKDRSTPFPCMDKPCGCVTAEQCFSNCCCNTPAETLAWAKAHGIDRAVIAALQRRVAAPAEKAVVASSCCSTKKQATCCSAASEPACRSKEPPVALGRSSDEGPASQHTVVLKSMLACGGIVAQWLSIGGATPPPVVVAVVSIVPLVEAILPGDDVSFDERAAPAAPPPRVC